MSVTALGLSYPLDVAPTPNVVRAAATYDSVIANAATGVTPAVHITPPTPTGREASAQNVSRVLNTLMKFIPSDVLTVYLAIQNSIKSAYGPFDNGTDEGATTAALVNIGVCLVFIIFWIIAMRLVAARATSKQFVPPYFAIASGIVSFLAYAFAADTILVNSANASHATTFYAAVAVLVVPVGLLLMNRLLRVVWPSQALP